MPKTFSTFRYFPKLLTSIECAMKNSFAFTEENKEKDFFMESLGHKCFPVNIAKYLRTLFFTEHLWMSDSVINLLKLLLMYMNSIFWLLFTESQTAIVDLQAMWYPTVRRTLVCLSKLYNCIGVRTIKKAESQYEILCCVSVYTLTL